MAKNLAIFCDGTWNHLDAAEPTNVAILSKNVPPVTAGGVVQKAIYMPGVGAPRQEAGLVERALDRVTGGALGWGLDGKLKAAYREVARHYQPGDRLFLFGYSRGAYMARSLAGLLRSCGLPRRRHSARVRARACRHGDKRAQRGGLRCAHCGEIHTHPA